MDDYGLRRVIVFLMDAVRKVTIMMDYEMRDLLKRSTIVDRSTEFLPRRRKQSMEVGLYELRISSEEVKPEFSATAEKSRLTQDPERTHWSHGPILCQVLPQRSGRARS